MRWQLLVDIIAAATADPRPMENRILKHRSCKQPEGVGCQFGASGTVSGSSSGSKLTLNNNKINN